MVERLHALVLAAGLGTRLRPLTNLRAKPAMPVAGTPLIRRIVRWLVAHDISDIVVNLHYLPHTIGAVLGDGSDLSARIRYSWEQPRILGSAGGPRHALSLLDSDPVLLVNGDVLTEVDLGALARAHAERNALVTLALVPNREPHRYGGVLLDAEHRVRGFVPRGAAAAGSYHFVGPQIVAAQVFQPLSDGLPERSIGGVYDELLVRRPGSIRGFVSDAPYWDIGTPLDYLETSLAFARREPAAHDRVTGGGGSATVRESIIWDNVRIGAGCEIEHCIVADNVQVPAGTKYKNMVLMPSASGAVAASAIETAQ